MLRKEAETLLSRESRPLPDTIPDNVMALLHELNVHQVQLEMQNEELRRSEQELQTAHHYRDALFHGSPLGYIVLTPDGGILEANQAAEDLFRYPYGLASAPLHIFLVQEHRPLLEQAQARAAEGEAARCELRYSRFNEATLRWLRVNISRLSDAQQDTTLYLCALEDITREKHFEHNLVMAKRAVEEEVRKQTRKLFEANNELLSSRELFRSYFDGAGEGFIISDPEFTIQRVNRTALQMLGYESESQLIGANARDLIHPEDLKRTPLATSMSQSRKGGVVRVERRYRKADGSYLPVFVTLRFIPDTNQHHVIFQDISEKKRAQELLERSEAEKTLILESISDMVAFYDSEDLRIRWVNKAAADSVGMSCEELAGCRCEELWASGTGLCPSCPVRETFRTGAPGHIERCTADGRVWSLWSHPALGPDGKLKGVVEVAREITAQVHAEAALEHSERRFRELMEDVDMVAMQGYDAGRRVIFWNTASERLYGYSREEALGRRIEELIIPEAMCEDVICNITDWVAHGKRIPAGELELKRKDGSLVPVYSCHVMHEPPTGGKELFCIDVDLSAIRQAHDQLLQAKNEAEAANRAKSEFLANMSHELRTPLNGIMGMLQLISSTELTPEQAEFAAMARQSCRRLARLLGDILDLSRIEAGKMEIRSEPLDIADAVSGVMELFRPAMDPEEVEVLVYVDPAIPEGLRGDAARLQQVLNNLVGNALKFTSSGHVTVEVHALSRQHFQEHRLLFTVSDTGPGIADAKLSELFKPFTQADGSYRRQFQGAGLGLSIVKRIVELLGGVLCVVSEEGAGAAFHVSIPFAQDPASSATRPASVQPAAQVKDVSRVLLVEDDQLNALVVTRQLEQAGMGVTLAQDGRAALELLRRQPFDLVLMDIQVPVMDGVEATRRIRQGQAGEHARDLPIIALTACAMAGDRQTFLDAGMDAYLAKPVELAELMRVIGQAMSRRPKPRLE